MPPNHTHKIILSSALYYQYLHVIHEYNSNDINDQKCNNVFNN